MHVSSKFNWLVFKTVQMRGERSNFYIGNYDNLYCNMKQPPFEIQKKATFQILSDILNRRTSCFMCYNFLLIDWSLSLLVFSYTDVLHHWQFLKFIFLQRCELIVKFVWINIFYIFVCGPVIFICCFALTRLLFCTCCRLLFRTLMWLDVLRWSWRKKMSYLNTIFLSRYWFNSSV